MFDFAGSKIKSIATSWTIIMSVLLTVLALIIAFQGGSSSIIIGIVVEIIGLIFIFISALLMYAYGQMVENTDIIVELLEQKIQNDDKDT